MKSKCPACGREVEHCTEDFDVIKEILVKNLREQVSSFEAKASGIVNRIEKATDPREIMDLKQRLLETWVDDIPLATGYCYFCLYHSTNHDGWCTNCDFCGYAKVHGKCGVEFGGVRSDWGKIKDMKDELSSTISNCYNDPRHREFE